ncbi:MAG TPA: xanthine dehydrogenase family protein molybdopterin-binding subunit, partial [Pseudolabrys sp.]
MGEFAIGQGVSRFEDPRLLQGGGRYVDDIKLPGMAHGVVVRSQHAHAKIKSLDVSAAKEAPGVLAVLTAADIKAAGWGDLPIPGGLKRRDGSPMIKTRYPILAEDRVRWVGDCVAFVVAETVAQALDAAELVAVDFEPLPAMTSTEAAAKPGAVKVWDDAPDNVCFVELIGDKAATDAAFAKADHVVKQKLVINRVTAATMEPRGAVGDYNAADERYTLYTAIQRPHPTRIDFAKMMRIRESKIRIVTNDTGGSFGMKSPIFNEMPLVLLASKVTGRPVKWISTRTEAFLSDAQARDNVTEAEMALDKNGIMLGFRVKTIAAIGAYLQTAMPAFVFNAGSLAGTYKTPAIHVDISAVFTHTNPIRPYRGNGRPEAGFVIERMVDCAADQLGIDPAELRRRNYVPPSAMPYKTPLTFTWDCGEFEKNMDLAMQAADVKGFKARKAEAATRGKLRGLGMSNTIERAAPAGLEGAEVRFDRDGTLLLFSGANNQGQGHQTAFTQIVCDRLGVDPKDTQYIQGDTDQVFFGEGTGGSRSSAMAGSAFHLAAEKIVTKARAIAAHMLQVQPDDLRYDEGVFSTSKTNRTLSMKELAAAALEPKNLPKDMEAGLFANAVYSAPVANYPNGVHICELEIDRDTGQVQIVRYHVVDDVGTVINPLLMHGQVQGGIAQGVGQALMEDIHFD